jgi:manganese/zinc/iron transport system permease protein
MLVLAATIGGGAGALGAVISASGAGLPTGPVIVLVASVVLVASLLLAPRRGLAWAWLEERRAAARIRRENLLKDLYRLGEPPLAAAHGPGAWEEFTSLPHLMGVRGSTASGVQTTARRLASRGLVERSEDGLRLTDSGFAEAASVVRKHRLWELYLTHRLELAEDHVHRDAEAMEHALTDADVARLDDLLGHPETDPHGRPIPRPTGATP